MFFGEAYQGAQFLGIGSQRVVANAAFIAATICEGGVNEVEYVDCY